MIKNKDVQNFFKERPAINQSAFAKELGISGRYMRRLIAGESQPSAKLSVRLRANFNKYGYYV